MLFSELAKRVAEKYPEVKTAFPMDCELSNVELYDPNGAIPPVDTLGIYTARQISEDMTLPLCFVCAGTPDQTAHDKIAYSDSNYIIIPQVSAVDVVYYIMSLFGDSFKQQKLYSNLIYMLLNDADLTSVFCEFSKGTGSQMLAIDISGKVLAYSKPFRVNHPHWIHSIEVGYLDNYLIEYILSYRVKHKMDMSPNTFVLFLCQVGTKNFLRVNKPFIGGQPPVNGLRFLYALVPFFVRRFLYAAANASIIGVTGSSLSGLDRYSNRMPFSLNFRSNLMKEEVSRLIREVSRVRIVPMP